jgi:hypothetical protein
MPVPLLRKPVGAALLVRFEKENAEMSIGLAIRVSCPPARCCKLVQDVSIHQGEQASRRVSSSVVKTRWRRWLIELRGVKLLLHLQVWAWRASLEHQHASVDKALALT